MIYLTVFIIWNIFVALIYGVDKIKAIRKTRRISESCLLTLAFFMGAVGAFFGVFLLNHKTRKPVFVLGVPFFVVMNVLVIWLIKLYGG